MRIEEIIFYEDEQTGVQAPNEYMGSELTDAKPNPRNLMATKLIDIKNLDD